MSDKTIGVGDKAPEFTLLGTGGKNYSLTDYRGRPVVLTFYPGDNTAVCTKQLCSYNDQIDDFAGVGAQVLGISAQGVESHDKFSGKHGLNFPLLADIDKAVSHQYGIVGPLGLLRRSVFVVDGSGIVRYAHRGLLGVTYRPAAELLAAVKAATVGA